MGFVCSMDKKYENEKCKDYFWSIFISTCLPYWPTLVANPPVEEWTWAFLGKLFFDWKIELSSMCRKKYIIKESRAYLGSTFAVASSIISILLLRSIALARQMSCLWPTLKLIPPSDTSESIPWGKSSIACFSWTYTTSWYEMLNDKWLYGSSTLLN